MMRVGIGYDIHKLVEGRAMVIGGIEIPCLRGPEAHSDGDVLIHAVCDALLGAMGKGDIGMRYPDTDPKHKDVSSKGFLKDVSELVKSEGFKIANLDCVIIAEEPKIGPYREDIISSVSTILETSTEIINVKGKTAEKLGAIGKGEAISAHAVVLLEKIQQ